MRILVDENIPRMTVAALAEMGHEVRDPRGTAEEGLSDQRLWQIAQREQRLLITTDRGFSTHRDQPHPGILVVRLRQPNRRRIHERVLEALSRFQEDEWPRLLVVMRDRAMGVWRGGQRA